MKKQDLKNNFLCLKIRREGVSEMCIAKRGFSFMEVLIVVVILSVIALLAIPMMGSAASTQLRSAANMVSSDLEYAKSIAVAKGQVYSVLFDTGAESYSIKDQDDATIVHPVNNGAEYVVDFSADSRIDKVNILSVDFGSTNEVKFDYLGTPLDGDDGNLSSSGTITLEAEGQTIVIRVEPVTGYVTIL